jgi:hypothetical protein
LQKTEERRRHPDAVKDIAVAVIKAINFMGDARSDDMQNEKWRDHQPQNDLQDIASGQASIRPMSQQLHKDKQDMQRQGTQQQDRSRQAAPDKNEDFASCLHRLNGNQAKGMIEQMAGQKEEQNDPADQPESFRPKGHPYLLQ